MKLKNRFAANKDFDALALVLAYKIGNIANKKPNLNVLSQHTKQVLSKLKVYLNFIDDNMKKEKQHVNYPIEENCNKG